MSKTRLNTQYNTTTRSWHGYANDPHESAIVTIFEEVADTVDIKPSVLYTIAIGEGLGFTYLDYDQFPDNYNTTVNEEGETVPTSLKTDKLVDGFQSLGVDDFGSEASRYSAYLPDDFNEGTLATRINPITRETITYIPEADAEFASRTYINELGENTQSAIFRDMRSAVEAFCATVAHRQATFIRHKNEFGYGAPTEDQLIYWTYVYYQGEGRARRYLEDSGNMDIMTNEVAGQIANLARERVASWRFILTFNIFTE